MTATEKQILPVGQGDLSRAIAFHHRPATKEGAPGLFWMGGYKSDMAGSKVMALDAFAQEQGLAATRFDYSGHGVSGGAFTDGTISRWLEESLAVFEAATSGPQIVVGSSMGGWLALLLVRAHIAKVGLTGSRIKGLVLIAPAVDMTKVLMWDQFDNAAKEEMAKTGIFRRPSEYGEAYEITRALIEDGETHLFGDSLIETGCPVHILQGVLDDAVPWQNSVDLVTRLARDDVKLTLVKDGDHRLSRDEDLNLMRRAIEAMVEA